MIERIHVYAEKYYFPLSSSAFGLISSLHSALSESSPKKREHLLELGFQRLLDFPHIELKMTKATGGIIILKDFASEDQVAALCARAISMLPFDSLELA